MNLLTLRSLIATTCASFAITPTLHARNEALVIGGGTVSLSIPSEPAINAYGDVAFMALDSFSNPRIYTYNETDGLVDIARHLHSAPGVPAAAHRFDELGDPLFNNLGQVAHTSTLLGSSNPNDEGIWRDDSLIARTCYLVCSEPSPAGTAAGVGFNDLPNHPAVVSGPGPVMNNAGQIAFVADLIGTGVTADNDQGIWIDNTTLLIREGDHAPGTPAGTKIGTFSTSPVINDAGQVAYMADLTGTGVHGGNNRGIWRDSTLIVREDDPAPGTDPGIVFSSLNAPVINGTGQIAFRSLIFGTGVTTDNNQGIWLDSTLIAREADHAPGTDPGVNFASLDRPILNSSGQVAFRSTLSGTGIDSSNDEGIWRDDTLIVREGTQAPGTPAGITFSSIFDPVMMGSGLVAFEALLTGTGIDSSNNLGVWLSDGIEQVLVARRGDVILTDPIAGLSIAAESGGEDGRRTSLNDFGQIAYAITQTAAPSAIMRLTPDIHWRSPTSGLWDTADNWTLSINPASVHDVFIDPTNTLTVTGTAVGATVRNLTIGSDPTATATLDQDSGATLDVLDTLRVTTNGQLFTDDPITTDTLTTDGTASHISINSGGSINSTQATIAGIPGSSSSIFITGTNGSGTPSSWTTTNQSFLGQEGNVTMSIALGAHATTPNLVATNSDISVSGTDGSGNPSTWNTPSNLFLGLGGKTVTLNVSSGAHVISDNTYLGAEDASTNTTTIDGNDIAGNPSTLITNGLLLIADFGSTATLNIHNGALVQSNDVTIGYRNYVPDEGLPQPANGTVNVDGTAPDDSPSTWNISNTLEIGSIGIGSLSITNGAAVNQSPGASVVLASESTANGALTIDGHSTLATPSSLTTDNIRAGILGTATLDITNGANVHSTAGDNTIAENPGSNALATIQTAATPGDATWDIDGRLIVGGPGTYTPGDTGGTGELCIGPGGRLELADDMVIWPGGIVNLKGGTIALTPTAAIDIIPGGQFNNTGGTIVVTSGIVIGSPFTKPLGFDSGITPGKSLTVQGNADIDTPLALLGGTLSADSFNGLDNVAFHSGTFNVLNSDFPIPPLPVDFPSALTVNITNGDVNLKSGANLTITGTLNAGADTKGNLTLEPAAKLTAAGSLNVQAATNDGTLNALSHDINFAGMFTNNPAAKINAIDATLNFDGGITNNGDMNLINTTVNGDMTTAPSTTITVADNATFNDNVAGPAQFAGTGTVTFQANYAPGSSPGITNFAGNLTFGPSASLEIEAQATITVPTAGTDNDLITIADTLTLNGTLNVIPLPDTGPIEDTPYGNTYTAITYTTRTPNSFFQTITGTLINTAFALAPLLDDTTKTFTLRATIPGDLNLDNKVSVADLAEFALNFDTTPGLHNETDNQSSWLYGDFNTDGAITVADLSLLALNFGFDATDPAAPIGLSLQQAATLAGIDLPKTAIPEPATAILLLTSALAIPAQRRRSHTTKQT